MPQEKDLFLKLGNFGSAEMLTHSDSENLVGLYGSKSYMGTLLFFDIVEAVDVVGIDVDVGIVGAV